MSAFKGPRWLGRYELVRRLAVGGMAEIFLARLRGMGGFEKAVVVKRILPHLASDDEFIRMFLDEARLAGRLHHPNVAQVFDVDRDGEDFFFVMELVEGRDLGAILDAIIDRGTPLALAHTLAIAIGVCKGLHYAHEKKDDDGRPFEIVHRDVSPSNVLVSFDGNVKVVDFGIARATSRHTLTQQGVLRGKLPYMSPEQIEGKRLDRRSDIYAIGTLIYQMVTGKRPFSSDDEFALARQIPELDVPPPSQYHPDFPAELEAVVLRALTRDRDKRYQTAEELALALESFSRGHRVDASDSALARLMAELFPSRAFTGETLVWHEDGDRPPHKRTERRRRKVEIMKRRHWYRDGWAGGLAAASCVFAVLAFVLRVRSSTLGDLTSMAPSYEPFSRLARAEMRLGLVAIVAFAGAVGLAALAFHRYLRRWRRQRRPMR